MLPDFVLVFSGPGESFCDAMPTELTDCKNERLRDRDGSRGN